MAFARVNLIIIKNCVCIIVHSQWVRGILYESTLFCQCVSSKMFEIQRALCSCTNESLCCLLSKSNQSFGGQLTLFVSFCFPTRRTQGIKTATILISSSTCSSRLIWSLTDLDCGQKDLGHLRTEVLDIQFFLFFFNDRYIFTPIFNIHFIFFHFWKRNTEGKCCSRKH